MLKPELMDQVLDYFSLELYGVPLRETTEGFYVERAFLNYYSDASIDTIRVSANKSLIISIDVSKATSASSRRIIFEVRYISNENTEDSLDLYFSYPANICDFSPDEGHDLRIIDDDYNVFYDRDGIQDPKTEWNINALANVATDAAGNFIFPGDHTNI